VREREKRKKQRVKRERDRQRQRKRPRGNERLLVLVYGVATISRLLKMIGLYCKI